MYAILGVVVVVVLILGGLVVIGAVVDTQPTPKATTTGAAPTSQPTGGKVADKGDFKAFYSTSSDPTNRVIESAARQSNLVEEISLGLNEAFALPYDVGLGMAECGDPNAFYSAKEKQLTICYELFAFLLEVFENDTDRVAGAFTFIIFHELGHAVIDVYQLPAVGREEDAADQLATLMLIKGADDDGASALAAAEFFDRISGGQLNFADEHSLNEQRVFNILCWLYGSDPGKYVRIVGSGVLPVDRAERCPDEYKQLERSWIQLLEPHLKG